MFHEMSRHRRFVLCLTIGTLAAGCAGHAEHASGPAKDVADVVAVTTAVAKISDLAERIELVGSFLPRRRTVLVAEVEAVIQKIPRAEGSVQIDVGGKPVTESLGMDIGQQVAKGDVLVQLDPTEFKLALASAQAKLDVAQRELEHLLAWKRAEEVARLRALKQEAEAHRVHAEAELKREEAMRAKNPGAVSQREYETYLEQAQRARALFAHADAQLRIALAGPTKEEVAVAKARVAEARADVAIQEDKLSKTTIRAPYDGVITDRYADQGDRVTPLPRFELMEIMDVSVLLAQVGVPERYSGRIQIGDRVRVRAEGVTAPATGVVVHINGKVEPSTRTFRIRAAIGNAPQRFKVGQFVHVALQVGSSPGAITVPSPAVTYTGGQPQVFVVRDGHVAARDVTVGIRDQDQTEIRAGLKPGTEVVVDDPSVLADGMAVTVRDRQSAAGPRLSRRIP